MARTDKLILLGAGATLAILVCGVLHYWNTPVDRLTAKDSTGSAEGVAEASSASALRESSPAPGKSISDSGPGHEIEDRFASLVQPMLREYCFACHGNGKHKGNVALDQFKTLASVQADSRTW